MVEAAKQLGSKVARSWHNRTWKREVATILLLLWCVWSTHALMFASDARVAVLTGIYSIVTTAVFTFALGAFGLDAFFKQGVAATPGAPK
jgi:hypothetical protein